MNFEISILKILLWRYTLTASSLMKGPAAAAARPPKPGIMGTFTTHRIRLSDGRKKRRMAPAATVEGRALSRTWQAGTTFVFVNPLNCLLICCVVGQAAMASSRRRSRRAPPPAALRKQTQIDTPIAWCKTSYRTCMGWDRFRCFHLRIQN